MSEELTRDEYLEMLLPEEREQIAEAERMDNEKLTALNVEMEKVKDQLIKAMTTPPDAHTLNACLARVIGFKWGFNTGTLQLGYFEGDTLKYAQNEWDPLHNANQLEEVEAWLKQNGIEFIISSAHLCNLMIVELILADGIFQGRDPDKKRAFALAIRQMEQGKP